MQNCSELLSVAKDWKFFFLFSICDILIFDKCMDGCSERQLRYMTPFKRPSAKIEN